METQKLFSLKRKLKNTAGKWMLFSCFCLFILNGGSSSAQPIISFEATLISKSVHFRWELSQHFTYQMLEVERATDHVHYSACLSINGMSNKVSAWDKQPYKGKSYYRLKVTDMNGNIFYSNDVIILNLSEQTTNMNSNRISSSVGSNGSGYVDHSHGMVVISDLKGNRREAAYQSITDIPTMESIRASLPSGRPFLVLIYVDDALVAKQIYCKQE